MAWTLRAEPSALLIGRCKSVKSQFNRLSVRKYAWTGWTFFQTTSVNYRI